MHLHARLRCRLRRLMGGPLVRSVDRLEAWAALTGAALLFAAAFLAADVSASVRTERLHVAEVEAANRYPVDAVALDRSKPKVQRAMTPSHTVHVQWFANGVTRDKVVEVEGPVKAGGRVGIWTDAQGGVVPAPKSDADARASGVAAGTGVWFLCLSAVATALFVLRQMLNRIRYRAWDRDLALLVGGGGSTAHSP